MLATTFGAIIGAVGAAGSAAPKPHIFSILQVRPHVPAGRRDAICMRTEL